MGLNTALTHPTRCDTYRTTLSNNVFVLFLRAGFVDYTAAHTAVVTDFSLTA